MKPLSLFAESIELFFGDANPAETRVYARLAHAELRPGDRLAGTLTGPYCSRAHTLPATARLVDAGPGESLLAQAIVSDPCFWTPELPYLYRAHVELLRGQTVLESIDRLLGIRPLGCRGKTFVYEGKPWVLRAVSHSIHDLARLAVFREEDAAWFVAEPSNDLCAAASEAGVLLAADMRARSHDIVPEILRLARHAAVGFLLLGESAPPEASLHDHARNSIFVDMLRSPDQTPAAWADALLAPADRLPLASLTLPVIACRPAHGPGTIGQRRKMCDLLQRDLAGVQPIAGYLV